MKVLGDPGNRYTPQERGAALIRCREIGVSATAREIGVCVRTLGKWRFEAGQTRPIPPRALVRDIEAVLAAARVLERDLRQLRDRAR